MKTTNFNWGDNLIDSRDLIARHEELTEERNSLEEAIDEAQEDLEGFHKDEDPDTYADLLEYLNNAKSDLCMFNTENGDELELLQDVIGQGEGCGDWSYGETLIHESHFTQYTEDLVNDCYEMPKEFNEGNWPWRHMTMDWESAAEEAKQDYSTIEADGETYYIRS